MKKSKIKSAFPGVHIFELEKREDDRGWLAELFRSDQLPLDLYPQMGYVSMTKPGVMRGPHYHRQQTDYFVFLGPGDFKVHLWSADPITSRLVLSDSVYKPDPWQCHEVFEAGESHPMVIIVPPGVIHGYKNISTVPGLVFNGPNALYAGEGKLYPVDEIRYEDTEEFAKWLKEHSLD